VNARTQSFVLLLFGGALLRVATTDTLLRFVRPSARPWAITAGVAILALASWSLARTTHERAAVDPHGHTGATRTAWLILAPVIAILVVAPPALGAYSAARQPATVAKPPDVAFPPLPAGNPTSIKLIDFAVRALWDDGRTLNGRNMALTGFVLRDRSGGFLLSRLVITCCAADARPVDIAIDSNSAVPAQGTWVTVRGTYAGLAPGDDTLPALKAASIAVISQPANPYDD
jgi:uncharacterized repeat protein (TIGR03943 family)